MTKANTGKLLTTADLALRWDVSRMTLKNWRERNKGPEHYTIGMLGQLQGPNGPGEKRPVRYRLADVVKFERGQQ